METLLGLRCDAVRLNTISIARCAYRKHDIDNVTRQCFRRSYSVALLGARQYALIEMKHPGKNTLNVILYEIRNAL
jgi:hypothetical protein